MLLGQNNEVDYRLFNILQQLIEKEEDRKPADWSEYRIDKLVNNAGYLTREALRVRDEILKERATDSNKPKSIEDDKS